MMNYEVFVLTVKTNIKQHLPERYTDAEVSIITANKNNSVEKTGLCVREHDRHVCPTVYMEPYYEKYKSGEKVTDILKELGSFIDDVSFKEDPNLPDIYGDYSEIQDKVIAKLVNRKMNSRMVHDVPTTRVNDLAEMYMLEVEQTSKGSATIKITNEMQEIWGVSTEQLHWDAMKNTQRLHPAQLMNMRDVVESMLLQGRKEVPNLLDNPGAANDTLFVLSNPQRTFGAECLQYPGMLDQIRDTFKEDYYVLPSSTHEVLIVPYSTAVPPREMGDMVRDVNNTQVEREDQLSYNVYEFQKGNKELNIAFDARDKKMEMER